MSLGIHLDGQCRPEAPDKVYNHNEHGNRAERWGNSNLVNSNWRQVKISHLRQKLKSLRRQFKMAKEEDRSALSELTNIRKRLISLRVEWHRRNGKERAWKRNALIGNPFGFTKKLLGEKWSGHLTCPVEEIDNHLLTTFSDTLRDLDLGPCRDLVEPPEPGTQFDSVETTLKEWEDCNWRKTQKTS